MKRVSLQPDLPMVPRLYSLIAQALRKIGRREEARRHLRRAKKPAASEKQ